MTRRGGYVKKRMDVEEEETRRIRKEPGWMWRRRRKGFVLRRCGKAGG